MPIHYLVSPADLTPVRFFARHPVAVIGSSASLCVLRQQDKYRGGSLDTFFEIQRCSADKPVAGLRAIKRLVTPVK